MIYGFVKLTHHNNENPMFIRSSLITRVVVRDDGVTAVYTSERNDENRPRYHLIKESPEKLGELIEVAMRYEASVGYDLENILDGAGVR